MRGIGTKFCSYIENVCNSAISENVSSYAEQLLVLISEDPMGAIVVFPLPSSFVYNVENYYKLYDIISAAVWPNYTCLRPGSMRLATLEDRSLSTARGFFYPWEKGSSTRLIDTVNEILSQVDLSKGIPLMSNLIIPPKANSIIVSGNSGSGKSLAVQSISALIRPHTRLVYIDPKKSAGARWIRDHPEVELVIPKKDERLEDFLIRVTEILAKEVANIFKIQSALFSYSRKVDSDAGEIKQERTWIVIEELEALEAFGNKRQLDALFYQLLLISLLGRESYTSILLSMQVPRNDILPIPIRAQMSCRIQLGRLDSSTTTYLFPDLTQIMMPYSGPGIGIRDIITNYYVMDNNSDDQI